MLQKVFSLESSHHLFAYRLFGAPIWKLLRIHVQRGLAEAAGLLSPNALKQRRVRPPATVKFSEICRAFLVCFGRRDYVVVPAEVRFEGRDGLSDPVTRGVISELESSKTIVLDFLPRLDGEQIDVQGRAVLSAATLRTALVPFIARWIWRLHRLQARFGFGGPTEKTLAWLQSDLRDEAGAIAETLRRVPDQAVSQALDYAATKCLYRLIFGLLRPKVVILVVSYGKEAMIDAARSAGAKVIELQHGIIAPHHLGYQFPAEVVGRIEESFAGIPDVLLLNGPAWSGRNRIPSCPKGRGGWLDLGKDKSWPVFAMMPGIMIVSSQPLVGSYLMDFVEKVAGSFPGRRIAVRIHPNQAIDYGNAAQARGLSNIEVDPGRRPLSEALEEFPCVVTGPSTVLFQAMAMGCAVVAVRTQHDAWLERVLNGTGVEFGATADEVVKALARAVPATGGERFYEIRNGLSDPLLKL